MSLNEALQNMKTQILLSSEHVEKLRRNSNVSNLILCFQQPALFLNPTLGYRGSTTNPAMLFQKVSQYLR